MSTFIKAFLLLPVSTFFPTVTILSVMPEGVFAGAVGVDVGVVVEDERAGAGVKVKTGVDEAPGVGV